MNGIHDMGGMHGMGPIHEERNEKVFHHPWESRVFALDTALGPWNRWTGDAERHQLELIEPVDYLRKTYYEKWSIALVELLVKTAMVTRAEIETGTPGSTSLRATPPLKAADVPAMIASGFPSSRDVQVAPLFHSGQRIRARNMHPVEHTRQPRYTRGKLGTIDRDHGVFVFPDTNARNAGEKPQHVYSVRFAARDLWGEQASQRDSVYVDLWDDHLEPA
jgi:nitrile hydratase